MTDWMDRPLADIADALQQGNVTAEEIAETAIARHDAWDDKLTAYKNWNPEGALDQAKAADHALKTHNKLGALMGIPISVKDIYGVEGFPIFAGSPKQLPEKFEKEGPVVKAVRRQLCVIPGKTHTVEFAFGGLGINPHWVTPRNPWDAENHRAPGGSSSGAGVSLLEGSAKIAFGTDTGGSVRIPASLTGNVGIKTSRGRWSTAGIVPLSTTFDTPGILTRSVADAVFGFEAIDAKSRHSSTKIRARELSEVRLGVTKDYFWDKCQDDIASVVEGTIAELIDGGAESRDVSLPEAHEAVEVMAGGIIAASEGYEFLTNELPGWAELLHPIVSGRMYTGRDSLALDYMTALRRVQQLWLRAEAQLADVDVLATPTIPITPPIVSEVEDMEAYVAANMLTLSNTMAGNSLNLCGVTIPVGLDNAGMPVGLQLLAKLHDEETLLSVALAVEAKIGTPKERLGPSPLGGSN
ncbi:MAG: amidase [Rhodospirillaceae bacterium]|jgi:aspartyl-tRNA(Asn)/glutamyl-tRNA(Gln) amidotransferase subunit A|nr:amidase [Rhodospirillaceae bacterium]MBT5940278.1 amidase [Rhodospirillaceae bacterium]MBT7268304.1 amidase [Rhodospirillaceae bacterium]